MREKEIDLNEILKFLIRNKKIISYLSVIFFLGGCLFSLIPKRTWEGSFEIVVNKKQNNSFLNPLINQNISKLIDLNLNGSSSSLDTELGIIESPSVLMPVINFINNENKKNNPTSKDLVFSNWKKNNLKVNLKERTSILKITYRDTNRDIILPVLDLITETYQKYSGKRKKRSLSMAKNFINDQINKYRVKSGKSLRNAQEYAISENLVIDPFANNTGDKSSIYNTQENNLQRNISIENIRFNASNKIKNIDLQISKIKELDENDFRKIQYIGSTIPQLIDEGLPQALEDLETQLVDLRLRYTEKDSSIKNLILKRKSLIILLKERAIGYLEAQRLASEALMESAMRPKEVLLTYKELLREASRDEETLSQLENELRYVNLESAKVEDPWELISKPTLLKYPVGPDRKKIAIIFLFLGFAIGSTYSFIKEKQTGLIFEEKDLTNLLSTNIIEIININTNLFKINNKKILANEILNLNSGINYKIFVSKNINSSDSQKFLSLVFNKKSNYSISNNLLEVLENEKIIFLTSLCSVTKSEVMNFRNRLKNCNKTLFGIFILEK